MHAKTDTSQKTWNYASAETFPDVGVDLMESEDLFKQLPDGRAHVVLEMLRHGDVTLETAAGYLNITVHELVDILKTLPIPEFHRLANPLHS